MDRASLLVKLSEIVSPNPREVGEDYGLTHKNWDSMAILSALLAIEEVTGLQMEGEGLAGCTTVRDVLDRVAGEWEQRQAPGPAASAS